MRNWCKKRSFLCVQTHCVWQHDVCRFCRNVSDSILKAHIVTRVESFVTKRGSIRITINIVTRVKPSLAQAVIVLVGGAHVVNVASLWQTLQLKMDQAYLQRLSLGRTRRCFVWSTDDWAAQWPKPLAGFVFDTLQRYHFLSCRLYHTHAPLHRHQQNPRLWNVNQNVLLRLYSTCKKQTNASFSSLWMDLLCVRTAFLVWQTFTHLRVGYWREGSLWMHQGVRRWRIIGTESHLQIIDYENLILRNITLSKSYKCNENDLMNVMFAKSELF